MTDRSAVMWLYRVSRLASQIAREIRKHKFDGDGSTTRQDILALWRRHPEFLEMRLRQGRG